MWRWLGSTYICVFGFAVTVLAASDADHFVGRPVIEINFTSQGYAIEDSAARELLETEVGEPLVMRIFLVLVVLAVYQSMFFP